jgi:hypothetical protein
MPRCLEQASLICAFFCVIWGPSTLPFPRITAIAKNQSMILPHLNAQIKSGPFFPRLASNTDIMTADCGNTQKFKQEQTFYLATFAR